MIFFIFELLVVIMLTVLLFNIFYYIVCVMGEFKFNLFFIADKLLELKDAKAKKTNKK